MKSVTVSNQRKVGNGCLTFIIGSVLTNFILSLLSKSFTIGSIGAFVISVVVFAVCYYAIFPLVWRFLFSAELKAKFRAIFGKILPKTNLVKDNPLTFTLNGGTKIWNPFAGIFISGGAGSGKSKSLIEPLIKEAGAKAYTGVVYDFKFPELAQYVETAYRGTEVTPYYFNFDDLSRSNRVNPIAPELMTRESFAREYAYTILANLNPQMVSKPDFWSDNSTSLLASVFWYLHEKYPSYCTLPHAISMILQPNYEALLMELTTIPKCAEMISPILTAYQQGADNQLAGVISSLQVSLSKINLDEIYYLMTENDFNFGLNEADSKGVLVIGNNPQLSSTYSPIIGLILTSISKQLNRAGKEKSVFMVDEFPTVYIPNVEQLPATARSNKVATILVCQDIAQIVDRYGKDKTETIISNLGNQFYGRTPNPQTAKRVSEIFGKEDRVVVSTNSEAGSFWGSDRSYTESTRETDRVRIQDIPHLATGDFFTILSEGRERTGISQIKMDTKFNKSEIVPFSHADQNDLKQAYKRVTLDVQEVILKNAIQKTQK